jgi:(1->4)-alpha-D-glucan 1-alpha-D-glucosylmutase
VSAARSGWRAAYRLQLRPDFGFHHAIAILDYLAELGVSHVYCSPILDAAPGSEHGYDVVAHDRVRAAIGGEEGLRQLAAEAERRGMGLLLDVVPNHMAIGGDGGGNRWWWDVLEHGPWSPHAQVFDIDWASAPDGKILAPVLGGHYRNVLGAGELSVRRTHDRGFEAAYYEHRFPLRPGSLVTVLRSAAARSADPVLGILADRLEHLDHDRPDPGGPEGTSTAHRAEVEAVGAALAQHLADRPAAGDALDAVLAETSADTVRLDQLLRDQHWRLARWQLANPEIAYRRFFDVTDLVALRTDLPLVFEATHRLTIDLVRDGVVEGLRIDHPDGLRDPEGYLTDLAEQLPDSPVWVEKILGPGEDLPPSWPVEGTTGYDFLDLVSRLFVDQAGADDLADRFAAVSGVDRDFEREALAGKRLVLGSLLAADLERVTELAARCARDAGWDIARQDVRTAIAELAAAIPVYRTYVRSGRMTDARDRRLLDDACATALQRRPHLDAEAVTALTGMLRQPTSADQTELSIRFQQLCASTAAKGIEDTALYRWAPVVARCEVGCEPSEPPLDADGFHAEVTRVAGRWPARLLDTSTHDTKRSEDVRARMAGISEAPGEWWEGAEHVRRLARERTGLGLPDAGLEHLLLQSAAGAWPISADRLAEYAVKAAREAKRVTSWLEPDDEIEETICTWVRALVDDPELAAAMSELVAPLVEPGRITGLAQLVLKLTCPGVPVLYQGTELWDHHLVDPDNRRAVDYDRRHAALRDGSVDPDSGALKLQVAARVLDLRRRRPDDLAPAARYTPLTPVGPAAGHAVTFCRGGGVVVVVPRLVRRLQLAGGWGDTTLALPGGGWHDVLADADWSGPVRLSELLAQVPVAVLERRA